MEIKKENIEKAYQIADENTKKVLTALFGTTSDNTAAEPNLDDYTSIKSYSDACKALGEEPINEDGLPVHIIALMKLETISRALWGRDFEPQPDATGDKWYYYPCFVLYTQEEIDEMDETKRGCLLSATADPGTNAGFGYLDTYSRSSSANADLGFRLCQETDKKAAYFGKQFIELWSDYLAFNFTTGEHLK